MCYGGGGGVECVVFVGGFDGDLIVKDGFRFGGDGGRRREIRRFCEDVVRDGVVCGV